MWLIACKINLSYSNAGRNPIPASIDSLLMQCKVSYRCAIANTWLLHIVQYKALVNREFFSLHIDYIVGKSHCIVNADFPWLQDNVFQCTGLPLLVMCTVV